MVVGKCVWRHGFDDVVVVVVVVVLRGIRFFVVGCWYAPKR